MIHNKKALLLLWENNNQKFDVLQEETHNKKYMRTTKNTRAQHLCGQGEEFKVNKRSDYLVNILLGSFCC